MSDNSSEFANKEEKINKNKTSFLFVLFIYKYSIEYKHFNPLVRISIKIVTVLKSQP